MYPFRKAGGIQILRCQGIAVNYYGCTLGALALNPSGFCNVGVYSAVKYRDGQPAAILGIIVDNSHQEAFEKTLREGEARYRIATEADQTGVWDHDLQTGEMVIDTNLINLLGFNEGEITRWDALKALFLTDDVTRIMEHSRAYINGQIPRFEVQAGCWTTMIRCDGF